MSGTGPSTVYIILIAAIGAFAVGLVSVSGIRFATFGMFIAVYALWRLIEKKR